MRVLRRFRSAWGRSGSAEGRVYVARFERVWTGEEVVPVFSRSTNVTESERGGV